ncbi:MAG: PilT/PilU family type 4a pilus ATPase [Firmicutes bacterium]|nr:PilT/PilU family type 4a pilus ATPase [Bacillota bacterium]
MKLVEYLETAVRANASDIFFIAGTAVRIKLDGAVKPIGEKLQADESEAIVREFYRMANRSMEVYERCGDDDFSVSIAGLARFRINAFSQRGSKAAVVRIVAYGIPDYKEMGIPEQIMDLANLTKGMVLVCGTAGSGKSTTLACIVDRINRTRSGHIITLEDPIEYLHKHDQCVVSQREIAIDTENYASAFRASLRQSPDVIQLGEMRDLNTIQTAVTAAETGILMLATLHTGNAVNTIDRIIDVFPPQQQHQIRIQLALSLETVICQKLLPTKEGRLVPAFEILHVNDAVRSLIREAKTHQIANVIATGASEGMITMDQYLLKLFGEGILTRDVLLRSCDNQDMIRRRLGMLH